MSTCGRPPSPTRSMWGTYTTDDQGRRLTVFATEQGLRYRIPFGTGRGRHRPPALPTRPRTAAASGMMGDDGEKFGALADDLGALLGRRAWVEPFFEALEENADWLTTSPPPTGWTRSRPSAASTCRPAPTPR